MGCFQHPSPPLVLPWKATPTSRPWSRTAFLKALKFPCPAVTRVAFRTNPGSSLGHSRSLLSGRIWARSVPHLAVGSSDPMPFERSDAGVLASQFAFSNFPIFPFGL